jgi:iron complex outermembrane receptor protein
MGRGNFMETWSMGKVSVTGRANVYGDYENWNTAANGGNKKGPAEVIFDLEARYEFTENLSLSVGVDNLLDTYPPTNARAQGKYAPQPTGAPVSNWYEGTNAQVDGSRWLQGPFGYDGGSWYARLRATF